MSDRLQISITATDGASRVFAQVATGANQMSTSIRNAGTGVTGALDQIDQAIARSQQSMGRWPNITQALQSGFQQVSTFMLENARIAAESEVVHQRLQASIEATGQSYDDYATSIQAAGDAAVQMAFDDEDALNAISAITLATGDAAAAIDQLGLVMDIARGRGIDLASAARIVIAADQERYGALARIGIQLDANATKEQALAALQAKFSGQAAAYADTTAGNLERLSQEWENAREGLARYSSEATTLAFVLPTLIGGIRSLATGVKALNSIGVSNKLGIGGGILAGLAAVSYQLAHPEGTGMSEVESGFTKVTSHAITLTGTMDNLVAANKSWAFSAADGADTIVTSLLAATTRAHDLNFAIEDTGNSTEDTSAQTAAWNRELAQLQEQFGAGFIADVKNVDDLIFDLNTILGDTGPGAKLAAAYLADLNTQFTSGSLSPEEYAHKVDQAAQSLNYFDAQAQQVTTTTRALGDVSDDYIGSIYEQNLAHQQAAIDAANLATAQQTLTDTFNEAQQDATRYTTALDDVFRGIVGNTDAIAKQSQGVADWSAGIVVATEHLDEWGNSLGWWSVADDLVGDLTISTDQYNAAVEANTLIQEDNAAIQRDVLSIQTQLAPVIATATSNLRDQMDAIEGGDRDAQLFALGMMDAATASQALALAQGYLQDQDTFGPMLVQAALLNPMLAQILEEMGLISYNPAEGTVTLTGAKEAQSDLDRLTEATEKLAYTNILISVDFDPVKAEQEFEAIFGHTKDGDPIPVDVPVAPHPYVADPSKTDLENFTGLVENIMATGTEPITYQQPVSVEFIWEGTPQGGAGLNPFSNGPGAAGAQEFAVPPVTVPVEADTSAADAAIATVVTNAGTPITIPVEADTSAADAAIAAVVTRAGMGATVLVEKPSGMQQVQEGYDVTVSANIDGAKAQLDELLTYAAGQHVTITVDADTGLAESKLSALGTRLSSLQNQPAKVQVEADDTNALTVLSDANTALTEWGSATATATVDASNSAALSVISDANSTLVEWGQQRGVANVDASNNNAIDAIQDATLALGDWAVSSGSADVTASDANAIDAIQDATLALGEWDTSSGTADINANDNASGIIGNAIALVNAFDGMSATATITTNVVTAYSTTGSPAATAAGLGGVVGYAGGGVVAKMAEWGPELLHFPNGGLAIARTPGLYGVPRGTYVDTAPATAGKLSGLGGPHVTVNINAPVFGVDDLKVEIAAAISEAWTRGMRQHEMSVGAY